MCFVSSTNRKAVLSAYEEIRVLETAMIVAEGMC